MTSKQKMDFFKFVNDRMKKTDCFAETAFKEYESLYAPNTFGKTELRDTYQHLKKSFMKDPNYIPRDRVRPKRVGQCIVKKESLPVVKNTTPDYDNMTFRQMKELLIKANEEISRKDNEIAKLNKANTDLEYSIQQLNHQHEEDLATAAKAVALTDALRKHFEAEMYGLKTTLICGKDGFVERTN